MIPERLPSLVFLVGSWVPAAVAGGVAAELVRRRSRPVSSAVIVGALAAFVVASSVAWFYINLSALPPYVPGATMDPSYAPPESVRWLVGFTAALILPVSALACWLVFRMRAKSPSRHIPR